MRPLPKTVRIGGLDWQVREVSPVVMKVLSGENDLSGHYDDGAVRILVLESLPLPNRWRTFFHEARHAMNPHSLEEDVDLESAAWFTVCRNMGLLD